ncbi:MAG: M20/M25/M40 family metallo-hydrolase [Rhodospirillales bacterium]|nr:M20/M25/M40 family metallo-hydrolase [Rhodospirillales bacterium]
MDEAIRQRIRKTLVARRADQFRLLGHMVRLKSENPPGDLDPHAAKTAEWLKKIAGLTAVRHLVPEEEARAQGLKSLANLVVRHEFGPGPTVALQAHGDTAPAGPGWSGDPFAADIREGVMYGRGVVEAKGSLAAYIFALVALKSVASELGGAVEIHITYDHETGGALGVPWLIEHGVINPDYAICPGGTWSIVTRHHGALRLAVEVRSQSAGAAEAGQATARVLDTLYALRAAKAPAAEGVEPPPGISVGGIHGEGGKDATPGAVIIGITRGLAPDEDPAKAEQGLALHLGKAVAGMPGVICRIRRIELTPPLKPAPGTKNLVDALMRAAGAVLGREIPEAARSAVSDARHYTAVGIPAVLYGAGPKQPEEAHVGGPNENLVLDDLRQGTEVLACALADFLKTGEQAPG